MMILVISLMTLDIHLAVLQSNPFNGDVCFGQSMGDALYIYDSTGDDYLDIN